MALVTPERYTALKARIKAECKRRAYNGSVSSYGGTSYDYIITPVSGGVILKEHRDKLAIPLNAINSDIVSDASNQTVIKETDISVMEAFTTTLEARSKTNNSGSDCKSGCTGLCYSCTGQCVNGCSDCGGRCSSSCSGDCDGCRGCGSGCADTCSKSCQGACQSSCVGYCDGTDLETI